MPFETKHHTVPHLKGDKFLEFKSNRLSVKMIPKTPFCVQVALKNPLGKAFRDSSNMRHHEKSVHLKIRHFKCDKCEKCYIHAQALKGFRIIFPYSIIFLKIQNCTTGN